jgi:glutamine phosphoribosylpyrophosphate amidotransferase
MTREKVYFSSAALLTRFPYIYGIDIPTRKDLIAYQSNEQQILRSIGCDWVILKFCITLKIETGITRRFQKQVRGRIYFCGAL